MKHLRILASAMTAVLVGAAMAGPAFGYQVLSETGPHGHYDITDSFATPGAKCSYGDVVYSNWAYLISMKVYAPHVFAADRNSEIREHRVVSWQWKLQRRAYDGTQWHTIKSSAIQKKTAYEDAMAPFTALKINYNAEKEDPTHVDAGGSKIFRALVIIKWYKPNGSVESTVKLVPDFYAMDTYWPEQPSAGRCSRIDTDG